MTPDNNVNADPLREAARAYVAAAFKLVRTRSAPGPDVDDYRWQWVRESPQTFRLQPTRRHWWQDSWLLLDAYEALEKLPEHKLTAELLLRDAEIGHVPNKMVGTSNTWHRVELRQIISSLVWRTAARSGRGELDISHFGDAYSAWRADLSAKTARQTWVAALLGLKGPSQPLALANGISIAPLEDSEISHLLRLGMLAAGDGISLVDGPVATFGAPVHGLRIVAETELLVAEDAPGELKDTLWREHNDLFEDVLIALRLFKGERVATSGFAVFYTTWPIDMSMQFGPLVDFAPPNPKRRHDYTLTDVEAIEFAEFFRAYSKAKVAEKSLEFAARRFAYAAERTRAEDRIIDLAIAAESIFLGDDEKELSFRLALRASCFLYPEHQPRAPTYQLFRNAYAVRSKIAHGSQPPKGKLVAIDGTPCIGPHGFADALEAVLRVALKKAIVQTASKGSFMNAEDWEALVLRDGT